MFLAPSRSGLGESLPTTTLLGVYLGEPAGKTPTKGVMVLVTCMESGIDYKQNFLQIVLIHIMSIVLLVNYN